MAPMNGTPRSRGSFRSRLGPLNPAFASAHGIPSPSPVKKKIQPPLQERQKETNTGIDPVDDSVETITTQKREIPISPAPPVRGVPQKEAKQKTTATNDAQAKRLIGKARTSGKLKASDAGLETPLPAILFDFPSLADSVDMSLDQTNPDQLKPWESYVAETLTLVDFSDNEGITEFPSLEPTDSKTHISWNSVERFRSIHTFRARRCKLRVFPVTPTLPESWSQLTTLDLSGNTLKGEFPLLYLPKSIRELDLSRNKLSSLKSSHEPSTSIDLPQLVSLDISKNAIASTGISPILHMPHLQRLNCGDNKIYNLNFILKAIASSEKSLTTLVAPKSLLSDLDGEQPIDLTAFVSLVSVDLSSNSLCRVPKLAPAVQRLNVNENCIRGIHGLLEEADDNAGDFQSSSSLVVLQIQRNKLTKLDPRTVDRLTQLNRLDLQYNALKDLPVELGHLTSLQQMFLEGNHLLSLRSSGLRGDLHDTEAVLAKLRNRGPKSSSASPGSPSCSRSNSSDSCDTMSTKHSSASSKAFNADVGGLLASLLVGTKVINYSGKHAQMLPFQLLDELKTSSPDIVQGVERLNISKNQLQTIEADWFTLLPQLTTLEAHDNRLSSLPVTIRDVALTHIYLSRNRLSAHAIRCSLLHTSPKSVIIADSLQLLDLSSNNLECFPPDLLRNFKSLRTLNLSRNRISSLQNIVDAPHPPCCHSLEHLNLAENQIEDLGGDDFPLLLAAGCPDLQSLKLENNELKMVPMTLGLLESLKILELRGNPQRMIRYEILDKSTTCVLQYMRNRMTSKTKAQALRRLRELLVVSSPDPTADEAANPENDDGYDDSGDTNTNTDKTSSATSATKPSTMRQTKLAEYSPVKSTPTKKTSERSTPVKAATPPLQSRIPAPKSRLGLSPGAPVGQTNTGRTPPPTSADSKTRTPPIKATAASATKNTKNDFTTSPLLQELEESIAELAADMDRPGLSEPKRYAIKKKLAMERSKRLREERRLKQERDHRSGGRGFVIDTCTMMR